MADPTTPTGNLPDPAVLEQIKQILLQINDIAQRIVSKGNETPGLFSGIKASLDGASAGASGLSDKINEFEKSASAAFESIIAGGKDLLGTFQSSNAALALDIINFRDMRANAETAFKNLIPVIQNSAQDMQKVLSNNRVNLAEAIVFDMTASMYSAALKPVIEFEKRMTGSISSVSPQLVQMSGAFEDAGITTGNFLERVDNALTNSARSAEELGLGVDVTRQAMNSLGSAGIDISEIFANSNQNISTSGERFQGLTGVIRMSAATGLEMSKVGSILQQNIRQLGRSANETGAIFAALSLAQAKTGLSMDTVSSTVMDSAGQLRHYGTSVESLSNTFNAFITSVGRGRAELGRELFSDTVKNLEGMNFGLKAFLGMQSQLGQGRGAIEAGLEFEQALSEGRMGDVFSSVREQLERMGGGQVLTRQQAMDTGQGTQYLMQRQLLSKFTGEQNAGKLDTMLGIIQRQEVERATEVFTGPRGEDIRARELQMGEVGQRRLDVETGAVQQGLNRLRAEEAIAIGKMVSAYDTASQTLRNMAKATVDGMRGILSVSIDPVARKTLEDQNEMTTNARLAADPEAAGPAPGLNQIGRAPRIAPGFEDIRKSNGLSQPTPRTIGESSQRLAPTLRDIESSDTKLMNNNFGFELPRLNIDASVFDSNVRVPTQLPPVSPFNTMPAIPAAVQPSPAAPPAAQPTTAAAAGPTTAALTPRLVGDGIEIPVTFRVDGNNLTAAVSQLKNSIRIELTNAMV